MIDGEFTIRQALEWLGLTWEQYREVHDYLAGRHGSPISGALFEVRYADQRANTTPAEVLAKHGIDPADPMEAARRFDKERSRFDA